MKRILFPVDSLDIPEKALAMAIELGQSFGAEIVLLHVQPYNEAISYPYAHLPEPWDEEVFNQISERIIANAAARFAEAGIPVTRRIVSGNPASEILECAADEHCDLIVMSTHGMNAVRRFLLGSVTNKVVVHANLPVLVVR